MASALHRAPFLLSTLVLFAANGEAAPGKDWSNLQTIAPESEVRITLRVGGPLTGHVRKVTETSLGIVRGGNDEALERGSIKSVAVRGDSHRRRNALIGLAVGAGAGLAIGAAADANTCRGGVGCFNFLPNIGKEVLTPLGALVGLAIGALLPTGRWHDVYRAP